MREWTRRLLDGQRWADGSGEAIRRAVRAALGPMPAIKDLLHGTWLGHPLHPALTDVPIGALIVAVILDAAGMRDAANIAALVATLGLLGSAVTGAADYADTDGRAGRWATVHAAVMVAGLTVNGGAVAARMADGPAVLSVALGGLALLIIGVGAHIGGEVVYSRGNMVDRHAWRGTSREWTAVNVAEVPDGTPTRAKAGAQAIVLIRRGERLHALHDVCAHAGCSLAAGSLVADAIECNCHGSRFGIADGKVIRGPAVYDQPAYETRVVVGRIEVRRSAASLSARDPQSALRSS